MDSLSILLIEDDKLISRAWSLGLNQSGYQVVSASSLKTAKDLLSQRKFDAAIVDVNLGDGNGLDLLKWIKTNDISLKTLFVTARQDEESAIIALQRGATEFIRKPVGPNELTTRLDRMFRYTNDDEIQGVHYKDFYLNESTKEVFCSGVPLKLSPSEYQIFRVLLKNAGAPVSRNQLLESLNLSDKATDRTIDSHISRIRGKIKELTDDSYTIESVWGTGYVLKITPKDSL